jgi:dihydroneopterin aldolase
MPEDVLRLNKMVFHAYHGVWDEERQVGQRFEVDVAIVGDTSVSGKSDSLKDTVDLYKLYDTVEKVVTKRNFKLVEALAETIARTLLEKFPIHKVLVRVRKPNSPIRGITDGIEVEIVREAP